MYIIGHSIDKGIETHKRVVRQLITVLENKIDYSHPAFSGNRCASAALIVYDALVKAKCSEGWSFGCFHRNLPEWWKEIATDGTIDFHCFLHHLSGLDVDASNNQDHRLITVTKGIQIENLCLPNESPNDFIIEYLDRAGVVERVGKNVSKLGG